ncbi:MAG: hypothetical protein AAFR04_05275 [Pseudomonadota bacterium]
MPLSMPWIIGAFAGAVSAMVFVGSANAVGLVRVMMVLAVPLPGLLAGLGWGTSAALSFAAAGAALAGIFAGFGGIIVWLVTLGLPVAALTHATYLNRQVAPSAMGPGGGQAGTEWYPPGNLLFLIALIGCSLGAGLMTIIAQDMATFKGRMVTIVETFIKGLPPETAARFKPEQINTLAEYALALVPGLSAAAIVGAYVFNLWLAALITKSSGRLARTWPDLPSTQMPRGASLLLAVALLVTMLGGTIAFFASAVAGGMMFAYLLVGLAIVHAITRGNTWRGAILGGVYVVLLFFNTYAAIGLVLLGLAEPFLPFKRKPPGQSPPPPPRPPPPPGT